MKGRYIIATIAIIMLVLAGCGEEKVCPASCDDANPCTSDSCTKDTGYSCRNTPIPGCSLDCGVPCTGAAGQYMEMQCDPVTKSCASGPKLGLNVVPSFLTRDIATAGNSLRVVASYNQPFNAKKDTINVKISMPQILSSNSDIKITRVELSGTDANKQTIVLAEKTFNRYIWDISSVVEDSLKMGFPVTGTDGKFTNMKLTVSYDYVYSTAAASQPKSTSLPIQFPGSNFIWINPSITQACPENCDDSNPGTEDTCSAATQFFCEHSPIPGKCGNFICDSTETKCTCADDCGPCSGDAGQYLSFICQESQCKTQIKPGTIQQPTVITDDRNMNFLYLQNKFSYNNPFDITKDGFDLEFKLYTKRDEVGSIKIVEARVLEGTNEIGSATINKDLNTIGSTATASIPVTVFAGNEATKSLGLKVYIEYQYTTTTGTELKKLDFTKGLGSITLINPTAE